MARCPQLECSNSGWKRSDQVGVVRSEQLLCPLVLQAQKRLSWWRMASSMEEHSQTSHSGGPNGWSSSPEPNQKSAFRVQTFLLLEWPWTASQVFPFGCVDGGCPKAGPNGASDLSNYELFIRHFSLLTHFFRQHFVISFRLGLENSWSFDGRVWGR